MQLEYQRREGRGCFSALSPSNKTESTTERRQLRHGVKCWRSSYTCPTAEPFVCVQTEEFGARVGEPPAAH